MKKAPVILNELIKYLNISLSELSVSVGYERPQAFYDVMSGKTKKISSTMVERIISVYPEISHVWLLTGEGNMLKEPPKGVNSVEYISPSQIQEEGQGIPVYDIDFTCGFEFRDFEDDLIIGSVDLPIIKKDAKIVRATGDSMKGVIANGDMVAIREIKSWSYFEYGRIYGIVTPEYRFMKYVKKHPMDDTKIILRSSHEEYDDIDLPKSEINKLFLVENILHITTF